MVPLPHFPGSFFALSQALAAIFVAGSTGTSGPVLERGLWLLRLGPMPDSQARRICIRNQRDRAVGFISEEGHMARYSFFVSDLGPGPWEVQVTENGQFEFHRS